MGTKSPLRIREVPGPIKQNRHYYEGYEGKCWECEGKGVREFGREKIVAKTK
jgi:hypothetical protein